MFSRRHGWQRPLHPLQIVGMVVYTFLVTSFYCFLGPFLGKRTAEIVITAIFSSVALSVMVLFIRCTAIDPSDRTRYHHKRKKGKGKSSTKLNYGFLFGQILTRVFRRMERKILKTFIRRKYLDPRITHVHLEPLLPYPLVFKEDAISSDTNVDGEEISFCSSCNFQVKKHSKHCKTCNRCVEGFDHHCRWLNNCVGKKNYTTFILLMVFVLLMLFIQGATAIAVFILCFADKNGMQRGLARELHLKIPRGILATISAILALLTAYGSAALGQLFFFHVVLIRKGMRTYDYILAMREENQYNVLESLSDSDFSSDDYDSSEPDSPKGKIVMSKVMCKGQRTHMSPGRLSMKIDPESGISMLKQKQGFRASIDPWKLIQMSKEKALKAAEKAKEKLAKEKETTANESLDPLPFEMKSGLVKQEKDLKSAGLNLTPLVLKERIPSSPGRFSSPRRRFSGSPAVRMPSQKYKSNFDLKLTEVSRELESYISKQVLCSVVKDGTEASPR